MGNIAAISGRRATPSKKTICKEELFSVSEWSPLKALWILSFVRQTLR
jgi:hypothetical protein